MATIAETIEIEVPRERAWDVVSNFETFPQWLVLHSAFPEGAPAAHAVQVGTRVKQKITFMGIPADVEWTVTEWDPPSVVSMDGEGPMGTTMRIAARTESVGEVTRVTHESQFGGAALTPMLGVVEAEARKAAAVSLQNLRRVLGLEPAAGAAG
jgi:carbon monoxide dehydrogenase subunit G